MIEQILNEPIYLFAAAISIIYTAIALISLVRAYKEAKDEKFS